MRLEEILCHTQARLKKRLDRELHKLAYRPVNRNGFLYAPGKIPVLLVAHLDTVHGTPVKTICRSDNGDILMSPQGIGGDDRAGVYIVMEILKTHPCHVLFCEDEETGAVGARKFVQSGISPKVNYMIEFDRKGSADAVFYDCGNREFTGFICGFGFEEAEGSFSDISVLAPRLGIAAVNLSSGYYNAHTVGESINLSVVRSSIKTARKILDAPSRFFKYIEKPLYRYDYYRYLRSGQIRRQFFDMDYDILDKKGAGEQNHRQERVPLAPAGNNPGEDEAQAERLLEKE